MDKKKVIEQIRQRLKNDRMRCFFGIFRHISYCSDEIKFLNALLSELQKSDWISVEDDLPPYGEEVLVISKKGYKNVSYRRKINKKAIDPNLIDKNDFILNFNLFSDEITHWCRIDKLEE